MANQKQVVNIINFIRGVEPRLTVNLVEPVENQLAVMEKHGLTGTFLFQYDALISPDFSHIIEKIKAAGHETGVWLEIVEPLTTSVGIPWRGRYSWDWHAHVGFSVGYTLSQREKIVDGLFEKYQEVFGSFPRVFGSWIIDAHTMNYVCEKYSVDAACICRDQWGTDGYTLWGAYYNGAYYPCKNNVFSPAQSREEQISIPVFRMLGSDPIYQYDLGLDLATGASECQSVVTLEAIFDPGGKSPEWVDWFCDVTYNGQGLSLAYAQAGQENSFGWNNMKDGITYQFAKFAEMQARGEVSVEPLGKTGRDFRRVYAMTPATASCALTDWKKEDRKSVWYSCRNFRANLFCENGTFFFRDIFLFNENYRERYFENPCCTEYLQFDNLPVVDGNRNSGNHIRAGLFFLKDGKELHFEDVIYSEPDASSIRVDFVGTQCGKVSISVDEKTITVLPEHPRGFEMEFRQKDANTAPKQGENGTLAFHHSGFDYSIGLDGAIYQEENCRLIPDKETIKLIFA